MYNLRDIVENFKTNGNFTGSILFNEPIAPRTTFRIGGTAPLFLEPTDEASLFYAIKYLQRECVPVFILGGGSNIVVSDKGFDGAVITTCGLTTITIKEKPVTESNASGSEHEIMISSGAGASVQSVVDFCTGNAFSGFEFFSGLPGTIGGAIYMNARCYGVQMSDFVKSVHYMEDGKIREYSFDAKDWDYKKSPFSGTDRIILQSTLRVFQKDRSCIPAIKAKADSFIKNRIEKGHFRYPSAGSVFRNNRDFGAPSGRIIDEAGLCGKSIGGAQVAPWHGNIIINKKNASSGDISRLVDYIIKEVETQKGIILVPEIIFCGKE